MSSIMENNALNDNNKVHPSPYSIDDTCMAPAHRRKTAMIQPISPCYREKFPSHSGFMTLVLMI